MSDTKSDGQTDITTSSGIMLNTVSGLPDVDVIAFLNRGVPVAEYTSPYKSSIDLIGQRGPRGEKGDPGDDGVRGQRWISLTLDQNDKIANIISQIKNVSDVLTGDFIIDTVSNDVYILLSPTQPEYLCNLKGKASDLLEDAKSILSENYVLQETDATKMLVFGLSDKQQTLYIPDDTTSFDIGATVLAVQSTESKVLIDSSAVTLVSAFRQETRRQGSVVFLTKIAPNTWTLYGDLKYNANDIVLDASNISCSLLVKTFEDALKAGAGYQQDTLPEKRSVFAKRYVDIKATVVNIAASQNGTTLVITDNLGNLYTSTDSGTTLVHHAELGTQAWANVATNISGNVMCAVAKGAHVCVSRDFGVTWEIQTSLGAADWTDVAVAGSKIAVCADGGYIYLSDDSGVTWVKQTNVGAAWAQSSINAPDSWTSVSMTADGNKIVAIDGIYIAFSTDSGITWTTKLHNTGIGYPLGRVRIGHNSVGQNTIVLFNQSESNRTDANLYTSIDNFTTFTKRTFLEDSTLVTSKRIKTLSVTSAGDTLVLFRDGKVFSCTADGVVEAMLPDRCVCAMQSYIVSSMGPTSFYTVCATIDEIVTRASTTWVTACNSVNTLPDKNALMKLVVSNRRKRCSSVCAR